MHALIPHHLTHLAELLNYFLNTSQYSLKIRHHNLAPYTFCDQLVEPLHEGFMRYRRHQSLQSISLQFPAPLHKWLVSIYNCVAGSVGRRHVAKGWNKGKYPNFSREDTRFA